jgi:hypothetical protein
MWRKTGFWKERGMRGQEVLVEMLPSKERVGERGMEEMVREGNCLNVGTERQICCSFAINS